MPSSANPTPAEVVAALQRGGIAEALRLVLAAKGVVSGAQKNVAGTVQPRPKPFKFSPLSSDRTDLSPGEVPRSNGDVWLVLFIVAALCVSYFFSGR